MPQLVLLRHGQSEWNLENRFTGWYDVPLTTQGTEEATKAGNILSTAGFLPTIVHTSLQTRAIHTANLALQSLDRLWIKINKDWRLNERHYGALTGLNKAETTAIYGEDQVHLWRRSYDVSPPPMETNHEHNPNLDARYQSIPMHQLPLTECLADVEKRVIPFWNETISLDLHKNEVVLIAAHGNSLRSLVKHLQNISSNKIAELNIPTGIPIIYDLGEDLKPTTDIAVEDRYLS